MIQEAITLNSGTKYPLKGIVTLPDDLSRPVPAVVLVHGSGSSNMDEKVGKLTPFKDLAQGLAAHGIAAIRYDKRSFAHGLKMIRDKATVLTVKEETIDDAIAAAALLRRDPRIDPERIFLIGHSMGGMLSPRIDAEGGNFRGLIILAGTLRKLEEVLASQIDEQMAAMPALVRKLSERRTQKILRSFDGLYDLSDAEAKARSFGGGTTLYYFKEMGSHPAADYLKTLEKPLLIAQGARDVQVKADVDFAGYQALLSGRPEVTFRLYPDLNHCFVPALSDSISKARQEFSKERHIGADVIADIAQWIQKNG